MEKYIRQMKQVITNLYKGGETFYLKRLFLVNFSSFVCAVYDHDLKNLCAKKEMSKFCKS